MEIKEELLSIIEKVKESNFLILVEGKKDKLALLNIGLSNVMHLNKRPLYEIIEEVSLNHKTCVLLMDLDKEGKKLYAKLNSGLSQRGVKVFNEFRNFIFRKTKLRQIEGIDSYLKGI